MNKMILGFGASLLLTAAFSVTALAEDAPVAKDAAAPAAAPAAPAAPAAAPAEQPKAEVAAPAAQTDQAAKPAKKVKKAKKHKHHKKVVKPVAAPVEEAATSRRAELSQAMAREVEKRKGAAPYGAEARAKDLDRDIENMTKAAGMVTDEAHKARVLSMLEHLKALRARYNP